MLTKELLQFTVRKGKVRPRFVDVKDPDLLAVAADMVQMAQDAVGGAAGELEESLAARANQHRRPVVARGLAKLVQDRVEVEPADESATQLRKLAFEASMAALAALEEGADFATFEAAVAARLSPPLAEVRHQLYADLPERRGVLGWEPLTAEGLLERYNLALAQGLVMYAHRLTVTAPKPDLVVTRRLLRWLKFCRLVAAVEREGETLVIHAEGPAAVLSSNRKYGLQLATFLMAVPLLKRFEVSSEVELPRRPKATLHLDHKDPLISTLQGGLGHIPEELKKVSDAFEGTEWTLDASPELVPVGATGVAVPDFFACHAERGLRVAVELFHPWHRSMLDRRLAELAERPDARFVLGVERALAKDPEVAARLEAEPRVFLFNAFVSPRALNKALKEVE